MSGGPINHFKIRLASRHMQIGLWLALADSYAAEICATCGYDWLLIDGEHAPNDLRSILQSLQAIAPYPASAVVRLPHGDANLIKQVMELGAASLIVPMVESADAAHRIARAMRYPPEGTRGVGSGMARSSRWRSYPDYLAQANDVACLIVQLETATALARAEEIAGVEGVDAVFFGPADLAASMGLLGQTSHPEVHAAIVDGIERVVRTGKPVGVLCGDDALLRDYVAAGASLVAIGVDTSLMAEAAKALLTRFNARGAGRQASATSS